MKMSSNRKKKIMFLVGVFVFSFCALLVISCTPPPPQASLDSDVNSGNAPLIVQFSDTSQGTIDSWEWDFGDGTSSTEQNPSHEYTKTGTYTVQLTVSGPGGTHTSTSAERITVGSGTLAKVETDPSQVNLRIQDSAQLSAEATDQFGNEVEGVTCSWVTLGPEVTVTEVGQVTAGKISGRFPGLLKLTASKNGQTVESLIDVIITPGPIKTIKMEPTKATLDIRGTQLFSFIAFDEFGNEISDVLSSWSVSSDIGNIDGNGLFTAGTKAGSFSDAIEIEAVEGTLRISATADVSISPDTLVNVDIQPPDVVVNGGASQQFTAVGLDQYGNEIPQLAFIWEARGGNIDDDGLFTAAGEGGVFEITAKAQSKGGMAMGSAKVEIPPNYPDFSSVSNLNLLGDAEIWNYNVLRVTPCKVFESGGSTVGAVWFKDKQMVKDGFETTFEFQLTNMSKGGGGGFAFVIQNHANVAMGTGGGALGYHAVLNSIAIEFDTDRDTWTLDPNDNHISVHTADTDGWNEADETYSIGSASPIINMSDREVHEVKIVYVPGTMTIFLDDLENPVLEVSIDIANPLNLDNGRAWVGFTASSNWARSENHDILSWSFVPK